MSASAFHSTRTESEEAVRGSAGVTATSWVPAVRRLNFGPCPELAGFLRARGGGSAIEAALALAALVTVFAGLMAVAHAAYEDDSMGRAARAAARAVALVTDASVTQAKLDSVACKAIKNELDLADGFDCTTWTVTVSTGLTPSALSIGANSGGNTGDMVLVTIGWQQAPWVKAVRKLDGSQGRLATGVARSEPTESAGA